MKITRLTGFLFLFMTCILFQGFAKNEAIIGLSDHELGDQTFSINVGLFIPLSFIDLTNGTFSDSNQTLGGAGALQWNAYLNNFFRVGVEVGISFTFGPDYTTFFMIPMLLKATYVLNYDRFEFPFSLGMGMNMIKYGSAELFNITLMVKPMIAAYYRYDSNLSFGVNVGWWCNVEFPTRYDPNSTILGNSLEITPALFYHF